MHMLLPIHVAAGGLAIVLGAVVINGFAYLATSFTGLPLPQYEEMVSNVTFPALFGEVAFVLLLLIKSARAQPLADPAS